MTVIRSSDDAILTLICSIVDLLLSRKFVQQHGLLLNHFVAASQADAGGHFFAQGGNRSGVDSLGIREVVVQRVLTHAIFEVSTFAD